MILRKFKDSYGLYDNGYDIAIGSFPHAEGILKLSKKNCDELFEISTAEELAIKRYPGGAYDEDVARGAFVDGFNLANKSQKDFSFNQVMTLIKKYYKIGVAERGTTMDSLKDLYKDLILEISGIEVEFETRPFVEDTEAPYKNRLKKLHHEMYGGSNPFFAKLNEEGEYLIKKNMKNKLTYEYRNTDN